MIQSEKFWDMLADKHDQTEKRFEQIHNRTLENTRKYLKAGDTVLDYGCATGIKTFEIAPCVKQIVGIDISSKMIAAANKKAIAGKIENAIFKQTTLLDADFENGSFDAILAFNILHLLEDPEQAVQKIVILLKTGGLFVFTSPCLGERMSFSNRVEFSIFILLNKLGMAPPANKFKFSDLHNLTAQEHLELMETENLFQGIAVNFSVARKV